MTIPDTLGHLVFECRAFVFAVERHTYLTQLSQQDQGKVKVRHLKMAQAKYTPSAGP